MASFLTNPDLRFVLFGGKGGAGKTTAAAATAWHLAQAWPDRQVLLVSTDPAHSLSDSLACPVGPTIAPVDGSANLSALALDAAAQVEAFNAQNGAVMQLIADRGTYFDKEDITGFFELSLPGTDEVMAIIKIMDLLREGQYDLIVLDTAPAGHTLRLLALPGYMQQWVHVMDLMLEKHRFMVQRFRGRYDPDDTDRFLEQMTDDLERVQGLLRDTRATEFVPVVNPEAMSIRETTTLLDALTAGGIPVHSIILNRLAQQPAADVPACPFCAARAEGQGVYRAEIAARFEAYHLITVPLLPHEVRGTNALAAYARRLFNGHKPYPPLEAGSDDLGRSTGAAYRTTEVVCTESGPTETLPSTPLLLFGGKGGVGKTTLAAATALELARRRPDQRTLLFSSDPASSLADSLEQALTDRPEPVVGVPGLYAMQIDAQAGMADLRRRYMAEIDEVFAAFLGNSGLEVAYDQEVMRELISLIPPGLDEIVAMVSLMDLLEGRQFDRFVLDTAPTGHMLRFLELPALAMDWFKTMFRLLLKYRGLVKLTDTAQIMVDMFKGVKHVQAHLTDAATTEFIAVTIPEAMGICETERFLATLEHMQVSCRRLIVNMVVPETKCSFCQTRRDEQQTYIAHLREQRRATYQLTEMPLFTYEVHGPAGLAEVSAHLYGA
jgi:arsenite/tail-anchored protein-transporting ATPase